MSSTKGKKKDGLAGLEGLGNLDDLESLGGGLAALGGGDALAALEGGGAAAGEPDPIGELDYENLTNEEAATQEISATLAAFKARAQREQERFDAATDSEYWVAVCFQTRGQKDHWLREVKLLQAGDKYIDGALLAKRMGVALPPGNVPYNTSARVDAKLAGLVREPGEPLP